MVQGECIPEISKLCCIKLVRELVRLQGDCIPGIAKSFICFRDLVRVLGDCIAGIAKSFICVRDVVRVLGDCAPWIAKSFNCFWDLVRVLGDCTPGIAKLFNCFRDLVRELWECTPGIAKSFNCFRDLVSKGTRRLRTTPGTSNLCRIISTVPTKHYLFIPVLVAWASKSNTKERKGRRRAKLLALLGLFNGVVLPCFQCDEMSEGDDALSFSWLYESFECLLIFILKILPAMCVWKCYAYCEQQPWLILTFRYWPSDVSVLQTK